MTEINEEELHDKTEEFRERALRFIPFRYEPERARIESAGSLKLISRGIDAFLERTRPKDGGESEEPLSPHDTRSARISVHRVFMNNLLPIRNEIEAELKDLVIVEEERE